MVIVGRENSLLHEKKGTYGLEEVGDLFGERRTRVPQRLVEKKKMATENITLEKCFNKRKGGDFELRKA